jgi:hypothetical protein
VFPSGYNKVGGFIKQMDKLVIGFIGVGGVMFAVAIAVGNTKVAVAGFLLFLIGIILTRLGIGD